MDTINDVLDYFINFEIEEKLNNIALHKNSYININKNYLIDLKSITFILLEKKIDLIKHTINKAKFRDKKTKNEVIKLLEEIKNNNLSIQENFNYSKLVKKSDYLFDDNYAKDILEINKFINDNKIYILYPVLASGNTKIPLVSFQVEIKEDKIIVNNYRVQINAFKYIISEILVCDISDVEYAMSDFEKFYESISTYENSDLFEIINFIESEFIGKFNHDKFTGFWSYKDFDKLAVTEEIILTMESFGDMFFPPYQEEIEEVKYHSKRKQSDLVNQYLLGCEKECASEDISITTHYGSYTSKYAINEKQLKVLNSYEYSQLLSISGPPGTGKTTVIKEIISNNIVKKAKLLIEIWNQDWEVIGKEKQKVFLSPLKGNCDFSMVIASSNNKAVDNIGLDLLKEIKYFEEILDTTRFDYKGVFCARLGNQENLDTFRNLILDPFIKNLEKENIYNESDAKKEIDRFLRIEEKITIIKMRITNYIKHRNDIYKKLLDTKFLNDGINKQSVNKLKFDCGCNLDLLADELSDYQRELDSLNLDKKYKENEISNKSKILIDMNEAIDLKKRSLQILENKSKIIIIGSFLVRSFEKKVGSRESLNESIHLLVNDYEFEKNLLKQMKIEYNSVKERIIETQKIIEFVSNKIKNLKKIQSLCCDFDNLLLEFNDLIKLGLRYIRWNSEDSALYNNIYLVNLRYQLFTNSLSVTKHYIYKHAREVRENLCKVYPDNWFKAFYRRNYRYNESYEMYLKGMWETIFLCFPVITTTLYSFNRMKFHMIQGIFDTLLIDEAGQASIHTVIAPLYRCRKAIIVGDPNQIEPIRSKNNYVIEKSDLSDEMKQFVDVNLNSIQNAADRASNVYDLLDGNKVGIILNEHRRCERSIAEFSNKYVYKNQLKIIKDDKIKEFLKYSLCMIDVRSVEQYHHVNNSEIEMCAKVINALISMYGNDYKKKIGIITPFRKQADILKEKFNGIDCGTVHAFQGGEKDVILFSIVSDSISKKNGMDFIGRKVNNLNVAFTRAKKQLILIGNYEACNNANNYMSLAMEVLNEKGKLFSIYEGKIFDDEDLEDKYKQQFFSLFVENNPTQKLVDIELEKYIENGVIVTALKHNLLLNNILPKIDQSVCIVTPWIRSSVVDEQFLEKLRQLLNEQKKVNICFGYNKTKFNLSNLNEIVKRDNYGKGVEKDIESVRELHRLLNNDLQYRPPIHCKILIIDDRIMIIGSHNWLSNLGKNRNAKDEISCVLYDKDMIAYVRGRYVKE